MAIIYEWDAEEIAPRTGEVVDHNHSDKLNDGYFTNDILTSPDYALVLVRDDYEDEALIKRSWAYVENGKLPDTFEGEHKVPKRFHKELESWLQS